MRLLKRLVDFFELPPEELPPEKEKEIIEKVAQEVTRRGLEIPALFLGWGALPSTTIFGSLVVPTLAPFLEGLGINAYEIAAFVKKRQNVTALIDRIEQLKREKEGKR